MADVSLNGLKVKTDSLPNDWYVSLINPKSEEPAEIMTVAKFVELFTSKQPEATDTTKGLMSAYDQANLFKYRGKLSDDFTFNDAIVPGMYQVTSNVAGLPKNAYSYGYLIVFKTGNNPTQIYIPDMSNGNYIYVRQWWLGEIVNLKWKAISCMYIDAINNLYSDANNVLTDTITDNYSILPPPPQIACQTIQNQQVRRSNLRCPLSRRQTTRMVQFQLKVNHRNSMSGRLTKSAALSWNYRQKTRDLNKSSISLTIARYNKCNLPRAGPPRLIN